MDVCGNFSGPSTSAMPQKELDEAVSNIPSAGESSEMNAYLENFFKTCDNEMFIDMNQSAIIAESLLDHRAYIKCLGSDIYLLCAVFQKQISIQIRKFVTSASGQLIPTRSGVTFNSMDWYEFADKLYKFNLKYASSSFISNNSVLVLNTRGQMYIQGLRSNKCIVLNETHLSVLLEQLPEFNTQVLTFAYEKYLPSLIGSMCEPTQTSEESVSILEARLCAYLEKHLSVAMQKAYICQGCVTNNSSQLRHPCIMLTELEKFEFLGKTVFLLVNFELIVKDFISACAGISFDFLLNVNFDNLCEMVFKSSCKNI